MTLFSGDFQTVISVYRLWEDRKNIAEGWHGFGIDDHYPTKKLVLYADPGAAIEPVENLAGLLGGTLPVDVLPIPRFRYCGAVSTPAPPQLGQSVFAFDDKCKKGPNGSIGGFLKYVTPKEGDPLLLLSACHVLARRAQCRTDNLTIRLEGNSTIISKVVHPVELLLQGNLVDAAVAEIRDTAGQNLFNGSVLDLSASPGPRPTKDTPVDKLGFATSLTHGRILQPSQKIEILPSAGMDSAVFEDQILVVSTDDQKAFVQDGDSGGLVVSNGVPVGIVIAKSEREEIPGQPASEPGQVDGRYALVSPIDAVLSQLAIVLKRPVEFVPNSTIVQPVLAAAITASDPKPPGTGSAVGV